MSPCVRVCFSLSDTSLPLPPSLSVFLSLSRSLALSLSRVQEVLAGASGREEERKTLLRTAKPLPFLLTVRLSLATVSLCVSLSYDGISLTHSLSRARAQWQGRKFFIDNLLVRIHLIIEMILVDRPRAMKV